MRTPRSSRKSVYGFVVLVLATGTFAYGTLHEGATMQRSATEPSVSDASVAIAEREAPRSPSSDGAAPQVDTEQACPLMTVCCVDARGNCSVAPAGKCPRGSEVTACPCGKDPY